MTKKGFTLIELLLYIAIAFTILILISVFLGIILQSRVKNQTVIEVDQTGSRVIQLINQTIQNAEEINLPLKGGSGSTLSLDVINTSEDPTVFSLSGSTLQITEGVGSALDLASSRVEISNVLFENLSRPNTAGTIRTRFTVTHANPENKNEYDYSKTFISSASLRQ